MTPQVSRLSLVSKKLHYFLCLTLFINALLNSASKENSNSQNRFIEIQGNSSLPAWIDMEQPDGKWQGGSRIWPGLLKKVVQEEMGSTWIWLIFLSFFCFKNKMDFFSLLSFLILMKGGLNPFRTSVL